MQMANLRRKFLTFRSTKSLIKWKIQKKNEGSNRRRHRVPVIVATIDLTFDEEEAPIDSIASPEKRIKVSNSDLIDSTLETPTTIDAAAVSPERMSSFRKKVRQAFNEEGKQIISMSRLAQAVNTNCDESFSDNEIESALMKMTDANQVMLSNGLVYLIWVVDQNGVSFIVSVFCYTSKSNPNK